MPLTYLRSITEEETRRLIMKMPSKSCELDPVTTTLLKQCVNEMSPLVTKLINSSTANVVVPDVFKHAIVRPLMKKANIDKNILKNYPPVSNLPFISKELERVISTQLREHIELHQLADPLHSAYRKKHSTETALLKVQSDISAALDNGNMVILVMLDLSAAFDTLADSIMLSRLRDMYGIQGDASV